LPLHRVPRERDRNLGTLPDGVNLRRLSVCVEDQPRFVDSLAEDSTRGRRIGAHRQNHCVDLNHAARNCLSEPILEHLKPSVSELARCQAVVAIGDAHFRQRLSGYSFHAFSLSDFDTWTPPGCWCRCSPACCHGRYCLLLLAWPSGSPLRRALRSSERLVPSDAWWRPSEPAWRLGSRCLAHPCEG